MAVPIITTMVDAMSLLIYFNLARIIFTIKKSKTFFFIVKQQGSRDPLNAYLCGRVGACNIKFTLSLSK